MDNQHQIQGAKRERYLARERVLAWWTLLNRLPSLHQALLVDMPGNLLELLAQERGYDCLRFPSTTLLERYGHWVESWFATNDSSISVLAPAIQPVRLSARPGWREYSPPIQPGLPFSPPRQLRLRQETLASLLHGLPRVGLVWINDPDYLSDILSGGLPTLLEQLPVLGALLPPKPTPELREHLMALHRGGYQFFDTTFAPIAVSDDMPREFIALPASLTALATESREWLVPYEIYATAAEFRAADQNLLSRLGGESPLLRNVLERQGLSTPLVDLSAEHWHAAERNDEKVWRWSGNEGDSRLLLPLLAPGKYLLKMKVIDVATADLAAKAQLFIDGWHQPGVQFSSGSLLTLPFIVDEQEWTGALELRIALPYTVKPNPNDIRALGLSLNKVDIHWSVHDGY